MTLEEMVESRHEEGFDDSIINHDDNAVSVRCSQCEALVISGIASHEMGCPNRK